MSKKFLLWSVAVGVVVAVALSVGINMVLAQTIQQQKWVTAEYTWHMIENTRTEIGKSGASTGDIDLIRGTLTADGESVGDMLTLRTVVDAKEKTGVTEEERLAISVLDFSNGTISVQTLYLGIAGQPTKGHDEVAIVGGTGAYEGARGEMSWILSETGDRIIKLHYTLD